MAMEDRNTYRWMFLCVLCALIAFATPGATWNSEKVLLRDIDVLTLYHGRYTTGRRSSRLPQLQCVGGTAGCSAFVPKVVQCYNRGSDGVDVQWECKTDMDNAYRFGDISVSCEGYDYPDDPFVLKGSCSLEYTIDLTKEGYDQQSGHKYYGSHRSDHSTVKHSWFGSLLSLAVIGTIVYFIYKVFVSGQTPGALGDAPPPYDANPPPPGFRQEYMPPPSGGCSSSYGQQSSGLGSGMFGGTGTGTGTGTGGGGFWSGAATGGLLGYLFGSRNSRQQYYPSYHQPTNAWGSGWGSGWGSSGHSGWGSSGWGSGSGGSRSPFSGGSSSSGTRTASGFGGTKRR